MHAPPRTSHAISTRRRLPAALLALAAAAGCGAGGATGATDGGTGAGTTATGGATSGGPAGDLPPPAEGQFDLLVYNVAGLPQGISGSDPVTNIPMMSPLLNDYDLVLVQEDFAYHDALAKDATHPYQSEPKPPGGGTDLGDGLNRFSVFPFTDFERHAWEQCSGTFDMGSDCLTSKGFSVALHELAPGILVDVYNLHMDAGSAPDDVAARKAQVAQLLGTIASRSQGRALIVAGDTNMDEEDEPDLQTLLAGAGLTDVCRALDCPDPDRIDRAMFRSSQQVAIVPEAWWLDDAFVTPSGDPLSDHEAVAVTLRFVSPPP